MIRTILFGSDELGIVGERGAPLRHMLGYAWAQVNPSISSAKMRKKGEQRTVRAQRNMKTSIPRTSGVLPLPSFFHQPSIHSIYFLLFSALNFRASALTTLLSTSYLPINPHPRRRTRSVHTRALTEAEFDRCCPEHTHPRHALPTNGQPCGAPSRKRSATACNPRYPAN